MTSSLNNTPSVSEALPALPEINANDTPGNPTSTSTSAASHRLRAAVHLLAVLATTPLLLSYVLRQYLRCLRLPWKHASSENPAAEDAGLQRTVLVTGGKMAKSLYIARALWRAGHRVVLVETDKYWCSGSRLSKAVSTFDTVADPRVSADSGDAYLADLQRVFEEHGCDTFLPVSSPFSAHCDAMFLRSKQIKRFDENSVASIKMTNDKDEDYITMVSVSSKDDDGTSSTSQRSEVDASALTSEENVDACEMVRECSDGKAAAPTKVASDKGEDDITAASVSSTDEDSTLHLSTDDENAMTNEKHVDACAMVNECTDDYNTAPTKCNVSDSSNEANLSRNMHFMPSVCDIMDDKHSFWEYCTDTLGFPSFNSKDSDGNMLPSHRLSSDAEVLALNQTLRDADAQDKYVLKNLGYDPLHRLDLFCLPADQATVKNYLEKIREDGNGVSEQEPWQAQLFIEKGTELSCFAVLRDSCLKLYTCALSSASQLRYVHTGRDSEDAPADHRNAGHTPLIDEQAAACRRWVDAFCAALRAKGERLDGQLCWDFMCTDGDAVRAFPLECNPRIHSQCAVFGAANGDQKRFGEVLVGSARGEVLVPSMTTDAEAETHFWGWWANEFYSLQDTNHLLRMLEMVHSFLSSMFVLLGLSAKRARPVFQYAKACDENATWYTSNFSFRDSDFDAEDPLPFLGRNLMQPLVLLWGVLLSGNEWTKYDFCIGKVVEKNGD
eukprot:CAMPEP_0196143064 /NCGR_PEP_ID=MMETSP0910-20130528/12595_1 /TAXON_ID=49265 /ORGANISM="Thalassiosira rotula, Strain GSO102" /LENGTH=725 /DNA_ID=CAMNT_0041404457 /DNA_START=72 /DNA_END=2249 /DNA_ORIENTATION=+